MRTSTCMPAFTFTFTLITCDQLDQLELMQLIEQGDVMGGNQHICASQQLQLQPQMLRQPLLHVDEAECVIALQVHRVHVGCAWGNRGLSVK